MPHVFIIHEVEVYPASKAEFDQATDEISYPLLRHDNDALVPFPEWSSLDEARRFFGSAGLVKIRQRARVKAPTLIYLQEIERGVL